MSRRQTKIRSGMPAVALLALLGCGGGDGDGPLGNIGEPSSECLGVKAKVAALKLSSDKLTTLAASLELDVKGACVAMAGMDATAGEGMTLDAACAAAQVEIDARISAGVRIRLAPPVCTVNAEAQLNCEADCYATAEVQCTPGNVSVRCEPGELSVSCEGSCDVDAYCEGSAEVAVNCEGSCTGECTGSCTVDVAAACEGTCNGTCDGTCSAENASGECEGTCDGTCTGTCTADATAECEGSCSGSCNGSCKIEADAGIECGANAQCRGGCSGTATAPSCTGTLEPPECTANAEVDCSGSCQGSASLDAECTEPVIEVVGEGEGFVDFKANIEAQLPVLLTALKKGQIAAEVSGGIVSDTASVSVAAAPCAVSLLGSVVTDISAAASASAEAAASVTASVKVSVDVQASASASAG